MLKNTLPINSLLGLIRISRELAHVNIAWVRSWPVIVDTTMRWVSLRNCSSWPMPDLWAVRGQRTAFARELREARFQHATRLLTQSEDKLCAIAGQVGLGETALRSLFRDRLGCTPEQFRRQAR